MSPSSFQRQCALLVLAAATRVAVASYDGIAGYTPVSDVVEHSQLDLDMQEVEENADLQTDAGFAAAYTSYAVGGNR